MKDMQMVLYESVHDASDRDETNKNFVFPSTRT